MLVQIKYLINCTHRAKNTDCFDPVVLTPHGPWLSKQCHSILGKSLSTVHELVDFSIE